MSPPRSRSSGGWKPRAARSCVSPCPTSSPRAPCRSIRRGTDLPLVADIHFDYRLALAAVEAGFDKIRINPGNIGSPERVRMVADACRERGVPIRVGVNSGSVEKGLLEKYGLCAKSLCESALGHVKLLEDCGFEDICISVKASDVAMTVEANRLLSTLCDYPLHIGVTEAGTKERGILKSAAGIGSLLLDGIGDTIRISLTDAPRGRGARGRGASARAGTAVRRAVCVPVPRAGGRNTISSVRRRRSRRGCAISRGTSRSP